MQEVTLQYTSCADPTESAARRQCVLQGEMNGLMEKTVDSIIAAAAARRKGVILGSSSRGDELRSENLILPTEPLHNLPPTGTKITRKRGRSAKKIAASPKLFVGAGSTKRLLSMCQSSLARGRGSGPSPIRQAPITTVKTPRESSERILNTSPLQGSHPSGLQIF